MTVKTDTKEKFVVLTPIEAIISANMTADIDNLTQYASTSIPHIIIKMSEVIEIAPEAAQKIAEVQQQFYERDHSFVICEMKPAVEAIFESENLAEIMNITATESEAWDIVQMEEIERELMRDFEED